jgi:hypothetical protein
MMKFEGAKYRATEELSRVQVAALIRGEIKAAVKAGALPKTKYSVRVSSYAGGGSIDVHIALPEGMKMYAKDRLLADHFRPHDFSRLYWKSEEARALEAKVEAIVSAYNFDDSDSMTDYFHVRFYGRVEVVGGDRAVELAAALKEVADEERERVGASLAALSGLRIV